MAVTIPSQASVELLKRTGVDPGQLGPNATPGRALTEAFQEKLANLRQEVGATPPQANAPQAGAPSGASINPPQATENRAPINRPNGVTESASQGNTKGDRVLNAFFQNRGEVPRGGVSLRARAESALATSPAGGVASPRLANALRTQAFLQEAAVGSQAARRGPSGLEEGFRTLAQGGGGGS